MITSLNIDKALQINHHSNVMAKARKLNIGTESKYSDMNTQLRPMIIFTEDEATAFLNTYKNVTQKVYGELNLKVNVISVIHEIRPEIRFFNILKEALMYKSIVLHLQYKVGKFRVDGYIPDLNLVIEYDEGHHASKSQRILDTYRQSHIESRLECTFVRLSYQTSDIHNLMIILDML